ncbi:MAG TPA: type II toxin-antitoxin system RelE/ParE family toxin [Candidatus Micrarchaeota archaeon]|nr:type II toxin-antitoxin system RelE/ParE family toxin [Candidatus Micrarchaeota archaeon]
MGYDITFSNESAAQLEALDKPLREQIFKKIGHLADNPNLGEPLSNVLKNKRRLHIGKYRIIYFIEGKEIVIAKIGHRKDVYIKG